MGGPGQGKGALDEKDHPLRGGAEGRDLREVPAEGDSRDQHLGDEITRAAGERAVPVLGSGHPLADIMLLKYGPQASEIEEGVAFYGRAGQAVLRSLQRLRVDPWPSTGRTV